MNINKKLFKISADHLIQQNKISVHDESPKDLFDLDKNQCAYRGIFGRKCAVGALISDEYYYPALEGYSVETGGEIENLIALSHNIDPDEISTEMLLELQNIHDKKKVSAWPSQLTALANKLGIDWTPPEVSAS